MRTQDPPSARRLKKRAREDGDPPRPDVGAAGLEDDGPLQEVNRRSSINAERLLGLDAGQLVLRIHNSADVL